MSDSGERGLMAVDLEDIERGIQVFQKLGEEMLGRALDEIAGEFPTKTVQLVSGFQLSMREIRPGFFFLPPKRYTYVPPGLELLYLSAGIPEGFPPGDVPLVMPVRDPFREELFIQDVLVALRNQNVPV